MLNVTNFILLFYSHPYLVKIESYLMIIFFQIKNEEEEKEKEKKEKKEKKQYSFFLQENMITRANWEEILKQKKYLVFDDLSLDFMKKELHNLEQIFCIFSFFIKQISIDEIFDYFEGTDVTMGNKSIIIKYLISIIPEVYSIKEEEKNFSSIKEFIKKEVENYNLDKYINNIQPEKEKHFFFLFFIYYSVFYYYYTLKTDTKLIEATVSDIEKPFFLFCFFSSFKELIEKKLIDKSMFFSINGKLSMKEMIDYLSIKKVLLEEFKVIFRKRFEERLEVEDINNKDQLEKFRCIFIESKKGDKKYHVEIFYKDFFDFFDFFFKKKEKTQKIKKFFKVKKEYEYILSFLEKIKFNDSIVSSVLSFQLNFDKKSNLSIFNYHLEFFYVFCLLFSFLFNYFIFFRKSFLIFYTLIIIFLRKSLFKFIKELKKQSILGLIKSLSIIEYKICLVFFFLIFFFRFKYILLIVFFSLLIILKKILFIFIKDILHSTN